MDWHELDSLLRWHKASEPALPPREVLSTTFSDGAWSVLARRGEKATGNKDLIAIINRPEDREVRVESFKQLVDDIEAKSQANRTWMKAYFLPHIIRMVTFESDPLLGTPRASQLPGYPVEILIQVLQVIALTESRKYGQHEPLGGRYLLVRVCAGLVWGVWAATDLTYGALKQNSVAILRATTGTREPTLGLVLAGDETGFPLKLTATQLRALSL